MNEKEPTLLFWVTEPINWEREYYVWTTDFANELSMTFDSFRIVPCDTQKELFDILWYYEKISWTTQFAESIVDIISNGWSLPN